jgi:hypothetical protein
MGNRAGLVALAVALLSLGAAGHAPGASANPVKKFEAKLAFPALDAAPLAAEEMVCPGPGSADGTFYKFFDLKGDFKNFKVSGPKHLVNEPSPVGIHAINDYDIDLYVFDAKCKDITPDKAAPDAGTEVIETKRPARFALVTYWSGIHPNLPITLEAANSKLK